MFFKKHTLVIFIIAVASLFLLSGCQTEAAAGGELTTEGTPNLEEKTNLETDLTLRLQGGDTGLPNPFRHLARGPGMSKMQLLYDSLLEKDEEGLIPWLASDWTTSDGGKVYTFKMQPNVKWHDGTPLTAEDAAFTFEYYKSHPPVLNDLMVDGVYFVTDAVALDAETLQVSVNQFDNTYLEKLGNVRILPKHIWSSIDDPAAYTGEDATIGSGPYKLDVYDAQQGAYRYLAFDDYWGLKPAASAIEWVPVSDRILAFENNEISLINASADLIESYKANAAYSVKSAYSNHSYRLMMNMETVPELQDVNLRRALAYGIDRQALVEKVARGAAIVSSMGYVPETSAWYNPAIEGYAYDPEKAKSLLDGRSYAFKLLTDNSAEGVKTAELIKLDLEAIGIDVTVESVESKTRDHAVSTGTYELLLINFGGMGGDPDYLRTIYGKGTETIKGWSDEKVSELAVSQAMEADADVRKEIIFELQERIADEVPMVILYGAVDNFVFKPTEYDGWMFRYDHSKCDHNKLSYLIRESQ